MPWINTCKNKAELRLKKKNEYKKKSALNPKRKCTRPIRDDDTCAWHKSRNNLGYIYCRWKPVDFIRGRKYTHTVSPVCAIKGKVVGGSRGTGGRE